MKIQYDNLLPKEIYFSNSEETVRKQKIAIRLLNGDETNITINDTHLRELSELADKLDLQPIIDKLNLKKSILMNVYKNQDNLRTYYIKAKSLTTENSYLIILSFGESQPTKYAIQIESVLQLLD